MPGTIDNVEILLSCTHVQEVRLNIKTRWMVDWLSPHCGKEHRPSSSRKLITFHLLLNKRADKQAQRYTEKLWYGQGMAKLRSMRPNACETAGVEKPVAWTLVDLNRDPRHSDSRG